MEDKYDAKHIARYFDELGEGEWRRLEADASARVSFHVHRRHLERYVRPGDRILEVGAGAGSPSNSRDSVPTSWWATSRLANWR